MKKRFLLGILMYVLSVQLLSAQTCQIPAQVPLSPGVTSSSGLSSGPTGQFTSPCNVNPNPTPTPTPPPPTPTPVIGVVGPKYVVMTVTYAPPGSGSSVLYSNSNMLGTSVSLTNSFTSSTSQSTQVGGGIKINLGIFSISIGSTSTDSKQFTQEADTTSSVAMNQTTTLSTTIPGPSSSAVGLDHDVDIIWVWLNPLMTFTANSSTSLTWNGFGFDARDPVGDMDIIGIPVAYLNGHQAIPADVAYVLARRWSRRLPCDSTDTFCATDGTADPGLNANDLAAILAADPFANPSYVINIPAGSNCTADGRFCRTTDQNLQYEPPPAGGQPITQSYSMIHQTTDMAGQTATDTRQVTFGTDLNGSVNINSSKTNPVFSIMFSADLKKSKSLTTTNKFNAASSDQVGQTAMVTVKGPAS